MHENVSLKQVFDHVKCTKDGLSSDEVKERLDLFVYSKLEEKKFHKGKQRRQCCCCSYGTVGPKSKVPSHQRLPSGDQLAIGKETGRRLGMGTNMYPSSALLGESKDGDHASIPIDELIEKADGFACILPKQKYEIQKRLQAQKHICGITGDGVNDAPALKKADIGISVADSIDARMKNYAIYAVSITIRIVLGFMLLAVFWKFDFPPFMVLVLAVLNDGTIMTISKDRVKPSPVPDSWKLSKIFVTGVALGSYLALITVIFFWQHFGVENFSQHNFNMSNPSISTPIKEKLSSLYLQTSTISQALIFVTRSRGWLFTERPGLLLVTAFIIAQLIATVISATATWKFTNIRSIGWAWIGVIWLFSCATYMLLDPIKFAVRYALSGHAWGLVVEQRELHLRCYQTAFTSKKDFGKESREAACAAEQRTLHGLQSVERKMFSEKSTVRDINLMAEEAKRRAEIARLRELHTLKGKVESFAKLKGLDIDAINQNYTV
ncbi:hypothetical protein M0R45_034943 [Rubus argutus]|uniref:Uncharacterized protein n=1 Tax=Rubus argutus TaxID=59490 RepID=A0AAW1VW38_RUBAR